MLNIKTDRIALRAFVDTDREEFARLNSDPQVMKYFPKPLIRLDSDLFIDRINQSIQEKGYGFWAAEHLESGRLMGFVGIDDVRYTTEFTPAVEIGWRILPEFWGQGLATEAARAALHYGFESVGLNQIVSFTSKLNERSYRVMQRIGMIKIGEFGHPKIEPDDRLWQHVLYGMTLEEFRRQQK